MVWPIVIKRALRTGLPEVLFDDLKHPYLRCADVYRLFRAVEVLTAIYWSFAVTTTARCVSQSYHCKRRSYRKPTSINGQVSTGDRSLRLDCRVLDMSATGARIAMDVGHHLPARIGLYLDRKGTNVECKVVWHRSDQAGLQFCSPIRPSRRSEIF